MFVARQRSRQSSAAPLKELNQCSNSQWLVLFQKYCDKQKPFTYNGPRKRFLHDGQDTEWRHMFFGHQVSYPVG